MICLEKESFVAEFGAVYEHSPWVANAVFDQARVDCLDTTNLDATSLAALFETAFMAASRQQQLGVLRAHPALACGRAERDSLSDDSRQEQSGAGLDQCTDTEFQLFREMNAMYFSKFDFPFIIAVKGRNKEQILAAFRERLANTMQTEFQTAVQQVCQIARLRIEVILGD